MLWDSEELRVWISNLCRASAVPDNPECPCRFKALQLWQKNGIVGPNVSSRALWEISVWLLIRSWNLQKMEQKFTVYIYKMFQKQIKTFKKCIFNPSMYHSNRLNLFLNLNFVCKNSFTDKHLNCQSSFLVNLTSGAQIRTETDSAAVSHKSFMWIKLKVEGRSFRICFL